jgi:Zn-dependent protease
MDLDPQFIRQGLIVFIVLVASIALHEWGHAVVADWLGDDTPRGEGRVTLNPLSHLDLMGSIIFPLLNIFVLGGGLPFIAWGRPVVTNPSNLKNRWRDDILISLAGPATNMLVALAAILAGCAVAAAQPRFGELVKNLVVMNVGLAVFNLLPIPPLDGASVFRRVVGMSEETYFTVSRWSWLIILLVLNLGLTRHLIALLVSEACVPYALLCGRISPVAFSIIFQS